MIWFIMNKYFVEVDATWLGEDVDWGWINRSNHEIIKVMASSEADALEKAEKIARNEYPSNATINVWIA